MAVTEHRQPAPSEGEGWEHLSTTIVLAYKIKYLRVPTPFDHMHALVHIRTYVRSSQSTLTVIHTYVPIYIQYVGMYIYCT